jgi:photosystem II stability/assembly factor-like uncharacterized protein
VISDTYVQTLFVNGTMIFAGTAGSGVFRSTDQGNSWTPENDGLTNLEVYAFAANGADIYAGTKKGVFISSTNGSTWSPINAGIEGQSINALCVSNSSVFAGTWGNGIFRSMNKGVSWMQVDTNSNDNYVSSFTTIGANIYVGGNDRIALSTDNGGTWNPIDSELQVNITCLVHHGSDLFAGTNGADGNVYLSKDNGASWKEVTAGEPHRVVAVAVSGPNLIAGSYNTGIWYHTLSDLLSVDPLASLRSSPVINYPNPFFSRTTISFSTGSREFVDVKIVDILGKECARLFSNELDPGEHTYEWDGSRMPEGMYVCIVRTAGSIQERPIMLVH